MSTSHFLQHVVTTVLPPGPTDATLSVTKAARLLGVHPNTIRAWSDAGRLRYYRINPRGDRRYRVGDLQRFLAAAETGAADGIATATTGTWGGRRTVDPSAAPRFAGARDRLAASRSDPLDGERHELDLTVAASISRLVNSGEDADQALSAALTTIRDAYDHHLVVAWGLHADRLTPRTIAAAEDADRHRLVELPSRYGILGRVLGLASGSTRASSTRLPGIVLSGSDGDLALAVLADRRPELAVVIPGPHGPWGVLLVVGAADEPLGPRDLDIARVAADGLGAIVAGARRADEVAHLLHRAEALRRVAGDIGSRLDLDRILAGLVDHAMVLFGGDRAAVFLQHPDGHITAEVSRGLSASFLASVRDFPTRSLPAAAVSARRPLYAVAYRDDPRGADVRAAVVQEGFDTLCTAPLLDGTHLLGLLNVYHDRPHHWMPDELETIGALATQASVAIRAAQDYERMATWAAQLQSIQQLGARLSRLSSVAEIGNSIATG